MENDPYGALQEAKLSLLDCFETINAQISKFASIATLSNFRKLYSLTTTSITLDELLNNTDFKIGKPISDDLMNQIFQCIDNETGNAVTFNSKIMAGYVLTPTLRDVKINNKTNQHEIDIEWSCISNTYVNSNDEEIVKNATAYEYGDDIDSDKLKTISALESPTINQIFEVFKIQPKITLSMFSKDIEKVYLEKTYFSEMISEHITFKFPEASDPHAKLDPFYMSVGGIYTDEKGKHDGEISTESLAKAGMMISSDGGQTYEYLSDVLSSINEKYDESTATLAQQFVKNCTVNAKIHEVDKASRKISIELYAKYTNSSYTQDKIDENWFPVTSTYCSEYNISEEQFQEFSKNFSKAYDYVDMYRKTKIDSSINSLVEHVVLASIGAAIAGITIGVDIAALIKCIKTGDFHQLLWVVIGLAVSTLCTSFFAYGVAIYSMKIDEGKKFSKALKKFNETEQIKQFFKKLDEDSKVYIKYDIYSNYEHYTDSPETYWAKYEAFQSKSIEHYQSLDAYYRSVCSETGWFNTLAKQMSKDVSKKAYLEAIDSLSSKNRDVKIAMLLGLIATSLLLPTSIVIAAICAKTILTNVKPTAESAAVAEVNAERIEIADNTLDKAKEFMDLIYAYNMFWSLPSLGLYKGMAFAISDELRELCNRMKGNLHQVLYHEYNIDPREVRELIQKMRI